MTRRLFVGYTANIKCILLQITLIFWQKHQTQTSPCTSISVVQENQAQTPVLKMAIDSIACTATVIKLQETKIVFKQAERMHNCIVVNYSKRLQGRDKPPATGAAMQKEQKFPWLVFRCLLSDRTCVCNVCKLTEIKQQSLCIQLL
jgi:hypothetical protein